MRYFYDTEFIEDGKTIDLISIGMVAEDGREYYAISTEFDPTKASDWVKENVLVHLPTRSVNLSDPTVSPNIKSQSLKWKSRGAIKSDLIDFIDPLTFGKPQFWGYYSAYDHVALCQLFGAMIDLPKGWPMYTRDLKQWQVAITERFGTEINLGAVPQKNEHNALFDARWNKQVWEFLKGIENVNYSLKAKA